MTGHVIVEADGGSRGNPGPAGCGAVVRDAENNHVLAERQEGIGWATNNVAEYRGLITGLEAAAELGARVVDVRMDSKLVIEQMAGRWQIKNAGLQPLAAQARTLAARFAQVHYEWVRRDRNAHADRLANAAMDAQAEAASALNVPDTEPDPARRAEADTAGSGPGPEQIAVTSWTGATGTPTRLLLLRHGQTELSVDRRYSGRGDVPLTEQGLAQVQAAAKRLADREELNDLEQVPILTSPLIRAQHSAQAVADALGGRIETHPGLVEVDFGDWEGLTFSQAAQRDPELHHRWLGDTTVRPPGGESFDEVHRRVCGVRDELLDRYGGTNVVVVSHVTPIKTLLRLGLDAGPSLLFRLHLDLASLSIVDFYPDGNASVRLVNDTSHLC